MMARWFAARSSVHRRAMRGGLIFFAVALIGCSLDAAPVRAQWLTFPGVPVPARPPARHDNQMLVQAHEIDYDNTNDRVSAVGNVQMFFNGSHIEADRIVYDQKKKHLRAEGNVRLTEPDGKITYGDVMDLSDDYRDGFVDSLRLDATDMTRLAATRADRSSGNTTVFQSGVYTACLPCKDDPKKPPLWQIKAARIIHDQGEKMIYFEDARIEFWGIPLAYMPFFSAPDPTVKRKTGFLIPTFLTTSKYGFGARVPYYWALAPDYDFTFTPLLTSKQGPLLEGEWRQRLINGAYTIRATGISQMDKQYFIRTTGDPNYPSARQFRGSVDSTGQFAITNRWVWGWEGTWVSDPFYFQDYNLWKISNIDLIKSTADTAISQLYLTGKGNRSYFDMRGMYFYGFSSADQQRQLPVVRPVVDYTYTFARPVLGGELGYNMNFTSLTRQSANFDPISNDALIDNRCATADTRAKMPSDCLIRGIPGSYTRFSAESHWKRNITDSFGQVFTPFASVRADTAALSVKADPSVSNYLPTGDSSLVRAMPTVGLEYRYPFISVHSWGTQTFEPIAQVIARPNESQVNKWPNEDAQSLIFDDSNLFRVDKFSGWDRVEGGGRANVGAQFNTQFNRGGFVNVLFGQSYQLFGQNSFAIGGLTNTGIDSGLDTARSDYVARMSFQPNRIYMFTTRFRFDKDDFSVRRFEAEGRASYDRWSVSLLYGDYAAQPELGFLKHRQGLLTSASVKLDANWVLLGSVRYDLTASKIQSTQIGLGYVDDCFILALNYITNYSYNGNTIADNSIMLQFSLRTLGGTAVSQAVAGPSASSNTSGLGKL